MGVRAEQAADVSAGMKRILVVDDDDHLREILPDILSRRDRVVDTARDGIEAIDCSGNISIT